MVAHLISTKEPSKDADQIPEHKYLLDDGTGKITGKKILSDHGSILSKEDADGSVYVRVIGRLKLWNNWLHMELTHIRPVTSPLEVYFHVLQSMQAVLFYAHGSPVRRLHTAFCGY